MKPRGAPDPASARTEALNDDLWLFHLAFRQLVKAPDALLRQHDLGRIHNRILFVIARAGEISVGDIADRLEITRQAIHGPMRQLRDRGLLASRASEDNRTVHLVRLSAAGKRLEHAINEVQRRHLEAAFTEAGARGAEAWRGVMQRIAEGAETKSPNRTLPNRTLPTRRRVP